jgi:hypothetical protein
VLHGANFRRRGRGYFAERERHEAWARRSAPAAYFGASLW